MGNRKLLFTLYTILLFFSNCGPSKTEIKENYKKFVKENQKFSDSIIPYKLYTDSLVLYFDPNTIYNRWRIETILVNKVEDKTKYLYDIEGGGLIKDSKLVIKGFQIKNPEDIEIILWARPTGGNLVFQNGEQIKSINYRMIGNNKLKATEYWKWDKITFDIIYKEIDSLPKDLRQKVAQRFYKRNISRE